MRTPDLAVLALKTSLVSLSVAVFAWAILVAPSGPFADLDRTADWVARGTHFNTEALDELVAASEPMLRATCSDAVARDLVIVKADLFESALRDGVTPVIDRRLQALEAAARQLLDCSPLNAFGWLGLFVSRLYIAGFDPEDVKFLRASYRYGPHELWIEVRRNFFALRVYGSLPDDMRQRVRDEFKNIVRAKAFDQAATILRAIDPEQRAALLGATADLSDETRVMFQRRLKALKITGSVPGIEADAERPWSY